jgi:hypothetical protein
VGSAACGGSVWLVASEGSVGLGAGTPSVGSVETTALTTGEVALGEGIDLPAVPPIALLAAGATELAAADGATDGLFVETACRWDTESRVVDPPGTVARWAAWTTTPLGGANVAPAGTAAMGA